MFDLATFLATRASRGRLLARHPGEHAIEVREHDGLRWFTAGGNFVQGLMDVARPATLVLPHHQAMLAALAWAPRAARLLNLGFGCGCFERFLHAHLESASIVSVDCEPALVDLARAHFAVPAAWPVTIDRAEHFVATATDVYDIVLCDIFSGEDHADCLFDSYFYADLAARLGNDGVLALNVSPHDDDEVVAILAALRQSIDWVMLAAVAAHGNAVVLASPAPPPAAEVMTARAAALAPAWDLAPAAVLPPFERLPGRQEIWGARHDADYDADYDDDYDDDYDEDDCGDGDCDEDDSDDDVRDNDRERDDERAGEARTARDTLPCGPTTAGRSSGR
ncbi:MAG: hypothetical protein RLW61_09140 [Gammaproteobacteria bacterium]